MQTNSNTMGAIWCNFIVLVTGRILHLRFERIVWYLWLPSGILPKVFGGHPNLETWTLFQTKICDWLCQYLFQTWLKIDTVTPFQTFKISTQLQCMTTANQRWLGSMVHLFHAIYTKTTMHINENTLTTQSLCVQFKLEVIHQIKQCNTVWMMPCYVKHCLNDPGLTASFSIRTDTQLTSITCHTFQTDMIEQSPKPSECHSFDSQKFALIPTFCS